jgi:hypothetical protein
MVKSCFTLTNTIPMIVLIVVQVYAAVTIGVTIAAAISAATGTSIGLYGSSVLLAATSLKQLYLPIQRHGYLYKVIS